MTKIYVSGPMTGYPLYNFPAFDEATKHLREAGYLVISPSENYGGAHDLPRKEYIRLDVGALLDVDQVVVLPDWESSRGACLEIAIAQELELPVLEYPSMTPVYATVIWVAAPEEALA